MKEAKKVLWCGISVVILAGVGMAQNMVSVPEEIAAYPDMIVYNGKVVTMDDTSFGLNTPIGTIDRKSVV